MIKFQYKVTLDSGAFATAGNGMELDRLIRDRVERVKTIEVLAVDGTQFSEPASAERSEPVEQG